MKVCVVHIQLKAGSTHNSRVPLFPPSTPLWDGVSGEGRGWPQGLTLSQLVQTGQLVCVAHTLPHEPTPRVPEGGGPHQGTQAEVWGPSAASGFLQFIKTYKFLINILKVRFKGNKRRDH